MTTAQFPPTLPDEQAEQQIVDLVRILASEIGGDRAARAVTPTASLERDIGLGSLERVELLTRIEQLVGRQLDDRFLLLDTVREIALALPSAVASDGRANIGTLPHAPTLVTTRDAPTLVDALRRRAAAEPSRVHVDLLDDSESRPVTYLELWDGASRIGAALRARGIGRGEPVAIMLPTGLDYLHAFMGVLCAGGVAVPLYPPARLDRMAEYLQRQSRILANAQARLLITMPEAAPVAQMLRGRAPALGQTITVDALRSTAEPEEPPAFEPTDAALIQYTSGSTGDPKGVLLSHANLLANIRAIAAGVDLRQTDVGVSWLPLYHDMGLIGTWLSAMVEGIPLTLMSPLAFLARPERWLWAIHQQRATLSAAPNFAYELCVRKIRDEALAGLDISSWRCALNGSEPVSAATLDRFTRRFERYGFRREALMPVYGLAESAVALCFPPVGRGPHVDRIAREPFQRHGRAVRAGADDASALSFVSVGRALPAHEVRIVDEGGSPVAERVVGRVLFRGPSCMSGYYRSPEATARARSAEGWIDSGDLAYVSEGELFITGRVKDLIIKGGRNLVPQEIEEVAGSVEGIRKGCVAAFGVLDEVSGTERLVVLAESHAEEKSERSRLEREVLAAVATEVGVPPDVVRVVAPGVVPKTPSGKIRRAAARDAYEAGKVAGHDRASLRLRLGLLSGVALGRLRDISRVGLRGLQVVVLIAAWAASLIVLAPVLWILAHALPPGRPVRRLGRVVARLVLGISGCRVRLEGLTSLPRRGPLVLVGNHTSYADTPALLAAIPIDFVVVAMSEIVGWPLIGTLARRGLHPLVDRFHPRESVAHAEAVEQRLRKGEAVFYFAEGGFTAATGLRPFRLGAFEAAAATGTSVVPVAIRGARAVLPDGAWIPRPGTVHVWIGEPLAPSGESWQAALDLRERTSDAIARHCGEPRLGALPRGA